MGTHLWCVEDKVVTAEGNNSAAVQGKHPDSGRLNAAYRHVFRTEKRAFISMGKNRKFIENKLALDFPKN